MSLSCALDLVLISNCFDVSMLTLAFSKKALLYLTLFKSYGMAARNGKE